MVAELSGATSSVATFTVTTRQTTSVCKREANRKRNNPVTSRAPSTARLRRGVHGAGARLNVEQVGTPCCSQCIAVLHCFMLEFGCRAADTITGSVGGSVGRWERMSENRAVATLSGAQLRRLHLERWSGASLDNINILLIINLLPPYLTLINSFRCIVGPMQPRLPASMWSRYSLSHGDVSSRCSSKWRVPSARTEAGRHRALLRAVSG